MRAAQSSAGLVGLVGLVLALAGCSSADGGGSLADRRATPTASSTRPTSTTPSSTGPSSRPAPSPTARDLSTLDPCTVITKKEADALAGIRLQPATRAEQLCTYPTPTSGTVAQVEIYVGDGAKKYYDIDRTDLGHKFSDPAGVGDEAHLEDGAIFFRLATTWFAIRLTRLDDVPTGPALTRLAGDVARRLR